MKDNSQNQTRYAQTLSEMVKFKTISNKSDTNTKEITKLHNFLKTRFPLVAKLGEWHNFNGGLLIKIPGAQPTKSLLLMSHMDVVEAKGDWKKDPFSGVIDETTVWGRGTVDTKGSLCAIFESVEELLAKNFKLSQDLYIFSSSREEIAGEDAPSAVQFLKDSNIHLNLVIDEGGAIIEQPMAGVNGKFAMIAMSERSGAKILIKSKKQGKLSGMENISKFILFMKKKSLSPRAFAPEVIAMFKTLANSMNFPMKTVFSNLWLFKPILIRLIPKISSEAAAMIGPTISFTNPQEQELKSLASDEVAVIASIGSTYYHDIDKAVEKFQFFAKKAGLTAEVLELRQTVEPEPIDSQGYKFIASITRKIFENVTPSPFIIFGGTDARHFKEISDSIIRFVPLFFTKEQFKSVHNANENINIESLNDGVNFYKEVIKQFQTNY
ncbi:MAG: M20/M25/M40 family metallo-hydrolase [Spirochaetales bacterium]|nr:M20/M25/M40 family metallo-hydrolase [Spirochaetales bacterium]